MSGGFFNFGPTYNSTKYVRIAYEGTINGIHAVDVAAAQAANGELAGKFLAVGANGVKVAAAGGQNTVGLCREDLNDMVNASGKASFYFRGGEYYVAEARLGEAVTGFAPGDAITSDANGKIVKATASDKALGTVTHVGEFRNGNMYEWAGAAANGGLFLGFILHI